ncbi:KilA-N domain-containing protein [Psychroflexus maritimus]|uniref:KilA-N domain-containing protein n=1 Tax=Psychroflexus maritimus TaxID=2714865 RepID=A0A967E5X4_9FLAO|nr:KilA-N domain-containing protein [Psychroflexus maritimus]NGZ89151.1 KilA-N domain-containing protein [Psychroflexus maritimus]
MTKSRKLNIKESTIKVINHNKIDYISLTDMTASLREGSGLIGKWVTNKNTLEYLGVWEKINNPNFNYPEFRVITQEAGVNRFIMSVGQWIERTNADGMLVKAGRYGGTYAHKDIAFHFAMWLSPEFQIYLVKEFQRLKDDENDRLKLEWNLLRTLAKVNYKIHTDAIKQNLIPSKVTKKQTSFVYADEADLLNVALFGLTAREWRNKNPNKSGNIRDYATLEQLVVLSNMESINALLIEQGLNKDRRLIELNKVAITQMKSLLNNKSIKKINDEKNK